MSDPAVTPSTIMQRMQPANVSVGTCANVPIELVQLSLVSCSPIVVSHSGGGTTQWSVKVQDAGAPPGTMTICQTYADGGTFTSNFFVQPVFTFTNLANPGDVRTFNTGTAGFPPTSFMTPAPANWVHNAPGQCGANFAPGINGNPGTGCTSGTQCCTPVGHSGPGHVHETAPPSCVPCECGACCVPNGPCSPGSGCSVTVQQGGGGTTAAQVCTGMGGTYMGAGTDCRDSDGDGLADVVESNGCCTSEKDSCHTGTSPFDSDTDNDGVSDGLEVSSGAEPCVSGFNPIDPCPGNVPAASTWGLVFTSLGLLVAGTLVCRRSIVAPKTE